MMRSLISSVGFVFIGASVAGLSACDKTPVWKKAAFEERTLKQSEGDVELPAKLWAQIRSSGAPANDPTDQSPTDFAPLKVYFIEKNRGILGGRDLALSFPAGGGEIDLSDYVQALRGSFHVVFEFMPEVETKLPRKVFFVSNAIQRKLGDSTVVGGCETYYDITGAVANAVKGEGFLINTTDQRHVSALSGSYFFSLEHDNKLYLASLIIRDSKHRELLCRK